LGKIAVLDVETTDIDPKFAPIEITELAIQVYLYNKDTKVILAQGDFFNELNEPSDLSKITPNITEITGITAKDVKGKKIDWNVVNTLLGDVDFVIAHNAKFDKDKVQPFLAKDTTWLCSFKGVDWASKLDANGKSSPNEKLEIICLHYCHWTYSGHRAIEDVRSVGVMIDQMNILEEMIVNGTKVTVVIKGYLDSYSSKVKYVKEIVSGKDKNRSKDFGYVFNLKSEDNKKTGKKDYWYEVPNLTEYQVNDLEDKLMNLMKEFNPEGIEKLDFSVVKQSY
jgi:hypothetical protein